MRSIPTKFTLLWIPAHCGLEGNERVDVLADVGTRKSQLSKPVSHAIVKAKIKARKWMIQPENAREIYGERRAPRIEESTKKRDPNSMCQTADRSCKEIEKV